MFKRRIVLRSGDVGLGGLLMAGGSLFLLKHSGEMGAHVRVRHADARKLVMDPRLYLQIFPIPTH